MTSDRRQIKLIRLWGVLLLLLVMLCVLAFSHLSTGEYALNTDKALNDPNSLDKTILALRLNRFFLASGCGGALALAGYLKQQLFNNPLVDSFTVGTASAAAFGANLTLIGLISTGLTISYAVPVAGTVAALVSTLIVLLVSRLWGNGQPTIVLLTGLAISSFVGALNALLTYIAGDENKLKAIIFWSMGGFGGADPKMVSFLWVLLAFSTLIFTLLSKQLSMLGLGTDRASHLGLNTATIANLVLVVTSLLVGFTVAQSGIIGFVGLMVPHFVRFLMPPASRMTIPFVAISGATLVSAADLLARLIYPPTGLPVGIVTALVGLPFFVYLLGIFAGRKAT